MLLGLKGDQDNLTEILKWERRLRKKINRKKKWCWTHTYVRFDGSRERHTKTHIQEYEDRDREMYEDRVRESERERCMKIEWERVRERCMKIEWEWERVRESESEWERGKESESERE